MAEKNYYATAGNESPSQLLYARTDGGRTIIEDYYPQSRDSFGTNKKFKLRHEEHTPSATVFLKDGIWHVHDFGGGDGHPLDCIEVCMKEEGLDWISALHLLLSRYGVTLPSKMQNSFLKANLEPDDKPGDFDYIPDVMTTQDLNLLGRYVKQEHVDLLNWHKAKQIRNVYKDCVIIKKSVIGYPIFVRDCLWKDGNGEDHVFYKIYEPMNHDKTFRFRYAGIKPEHYINGIIEAQKIHEEEIAHEVAPEKQKTVVIACGERDALNAVSMGMKVVWFNSESYTPTESEMQSIKGVGPKVVLIPDLDETGIARGKVLALKYPWLKVANLPVELMTHKDWRGNAMKDLRDWVSLGHGNKDFRALINSAKPADYFEEGEKGTLRINMEYLHNFLHLHNFGSFEIATGETTTRIMARREGPILKVIHDHTEIISFLLTNLPTEERSNEKYNLLTTCKHLTERNLLLMPALECELDKPCKGEEKIYFMNGVVTITADGIIFCKAADYKGLTLETNVVKHKFSVPDTLPLNFDFTNATDPIVNITNPDTPLLRLFVNTSRYYWQEEWRKSKLTLEEYYNEFNFLILSDYLTPDQNQTQIQSFLNKLYCFGYLGCRYKSRSEAKAVYIMDSVSTASNRNNGGSGKGTLTTALGKMMSYCPVSGRDSKLMQNNHCYDRITPGTRLVIVNDYQPDKIPFGFFYPSITEELEVNPKGRPSFTLDYEESPKFVFSSNAVPQDLDASTQRRLLFCPVGDWYHEATATNAYTSTHTLKDDFGIDLMQDYSEEQWNLDFMFQIQAIQYYLFLNSNGQKMEAPDILVHRRMNNSLLTEEFEDWGDVYFADTSHLNAKIERSAMFNSYLSSSGDSRMTSTRFKKVLLAYLEEHSLELNHCDGCDSKGRIIGTGMMGTSVEFFYVSVKDYK